jgi:23S rRNA G2445 N2-methylase RlmL
MDNKTWKGRCDAALGATMRSSNLASLLSQLNSPDERTCRAAGQTLLELGDAAINGLADLISTGETNARKSAAYLLGKLSPTDQSKWALIRALEDSEPKVRKNAAISLASFEDSDAPRDLIAALQKESIPWVRASQLLAIGKLGGPIAAPFLQTYSPSDDREVEAVRKARDRCVTQRQSIRWIEGIQVDEPIILDVPIGLEQTVQEELRAKRFPDAVKLDEGKLQLSGSVDPGRLLAELRCIYRWMFHVGSLPCFRELMQSKEKLSELLDHSQVLSDIRNWLTGDTDVLRYRFALTGRRIRKEEYLQLLSLARAAMNRQRMEDSPSSYSFELNLHCYHDRIEACLAPTWTSVERFSYRALDVGASINPVVAACLARLVQTPQSKIILDPTCGSGTLLFERVQLNEALECIGIDISPTAIKAAKRNAAALGPGGRINLQVGDAANRANWRPVDEVLANLPFGLRTARQDRDLPGLYRSLAENLLRFLNPGGRAVIYTADSKLWERSLSPARMKASSVHSLPTLRVSSGGISVSVFRLVRNSNAIRRSEHHPPSAEVS